MTGAAKTAGTGIVTLSRAGKPPLRFRGDLLGRRGQAASGASTQSVELWRMASGGFVVALTRCDGDQILRDAWRADSVDQALAQLEAQVDETVRSPLDVEPVHGDSFDISRQLWDRAVARTRSATFARLAGRALGDWDGAISGRR